MKFLSKQWSIISGFLYKLKVHIVNELIIVNKLWLKK